MTEQKLAAQDYNRRNVLCASAAVFLGNTLPAFADGEESQVKKDDQPTYTSNSIALENLARFWPKGKQVPTVITNVAALIGPWPNGIIGYFYLSASRPNDYFIENGADLWNEFGMFAGFANGTEYALWYYDGCPAGAEPVVEFGDEGALTIVSPNIKSFFRSIASGAGIGQIADFEYDSTPETLATRKAYGARLMTLVETVPEPATVKHPDFEARILNFDKAAFARNAADPTLKAIAALMANYFPKNDDNPRGASFKLIGKNNTVEVETSLMEPDYTKRAPLPEREALSPLIQKARVERETAQNDGRGPWVSGVLYLQFGGHAFISGDWE
jgi:hypothetical protein